MASTPQPEMTGRFTINPDTAPGHVHYTVADLDKQVTFYQTVLGFKLHWRDGVMAGLGAGREDLLRLTHVPGARRVRGTTGLYHTAFLVPTRWDLAQLFKRIVETRTGIQGTSNHGTHLAIYLPDAEGNGIELAWDFPQTEWPKTFAEMLSRNRGASPDELFRGLADKDAPWTGLDPDTRVGHVHLHVAHIEPTTHFYHDILGFDIPYDPADAPAGVADSMIFFSAGGYHHHIGANVWQGIGAPPPPPDSLGLRYFSLVLPDSAELERVAARVRGAGIAAEPVEDGVLTRDSAGNGVLLSVRAVD